MNFDHSSVDCPENIWANTPDFHHYWDPYSQWWTDWLHNRWLAGDKRPSYKMFQDILGRQTLTVVLRYRCRVWDRPEEGWTLYVDKRGPRLHVRQGMTPREAWDAFQKFKAHVDAGNP
jgi:hypothetical protein